MTKYRLLADLKLTIIKEMLSETPPVSKWPHGIEHHVRFILRVVIVPILTFVLGCPAVAGSNPQFHPLTSSSLACPTNFVRLVLEPPRPHPPVLRYTKQLLEGKILDRKVLAENAKILDLEKPSNELSDLPEQIYTYAIDQKDRLVVIPRTIDPGDVELAKPDSKVLASHIGIKRMLATPLDSRIRFVAAGEIVVRNGRVFAVSNGAGSFKGGTENLEYALHHLKKFGLKVDERTELRDFAKKKYPSPHGPEKKQVAFQARIALEASRDPEFLSVLKEVRRVMIIMERFPDVGTFVQPAMKHVGSSPDASSLSRGITLWGKWRMAHENEVWAAAMEYNVDKGVTLRKSMQVLEETARMLDSGPLP